MLQINEALRKNYYLIINLCTLVLHNLRFYIPKSKSNYKPTNMTRIALEGMNFFAYHGYYEEERIVGNPFIIDVYVDVDTFDSQDDDINDTVNYEVIYDITKGHMDKKYKLLETIALNISSDIKNKFPSVQSVKTRVSKIGPQLGGEVDKAVIEYQC